ncbi:hypothetical protein M422DRAFT_173458 [Sphaerobolus stellatus SS14]|uniref:Uncharacterized protein n=1 Tax=Sphaerobolus stellatus (strain SS14) TaxID=990650 RepID=A0A0C9VQZ8_SPHS4|nr:hypothetical protein M422DRAFT_173458 [Sphaerobolus stellatus SS14]
MLQLQREALPGSARAFASSFCDGPIRGLENTFTMLADTTRLKCCIIHMSILRSSIARTHAN